MEKLRVIQWNSEGKTLWYVVRDKGGQDWEIVETFANREEAKRFVRENR